MSGKWLWAFVCVVLASVSGARAAPPEAFDAFKHDDYATVLRVCLAPAKAGDSVCQDMLGLLYSEGRGVARDQAAAFHWFQLAAALGNPTAAYNLAIAYERGEGVAENPAEAEKWFAKAAESGLAYAQLHLAAVAAGRSDWKSAIKWLRPAAAQGLPSAQTMLALAYEAGKGVRRNEKLAAKWFEAAADHGDTAAQSHFAGLYERGDGVDQDFKESYFWYAVALRDPKDPTAKQDAEGLKRVAAKLGAADVADAAKIAKDWKPEEEVIGPKPKRRSASLRSRGGPRLAATGTGFYVARDGALITNNHVVAECSTMRISDGHDGIPVKVIATDPQRDLALLQASSPVEAVALFRSDKSRLGENVVVVGFPLSGLLSSQPIVTSGIISALAGMRDNQHELQISAPIQPGNSGGPLFDGTGRIAGVVVATLDTVRLARVIGVVPENVNFAIKGDDARQFLAAHGVKVAAADTGKELSTAAIAEQAVKMTVRLECWK
jgi:S1-C subfamily serine protease